MNYLDGKRLRLAVVAAAQHVLERQERLNRINVFPVPDGDTGTNMAMTLKVVADGAINAQDTELGVLSAQLAQHALEGARGNSGAILAQFFHGLAKGFRGFSRVDVDGFINSVCVAVEFAEQAVMKPVEGTILTVMKDWSNCLRQLKRTSGDLKVLLSAGQTVAAASLKATTERLAVLARAGVVDAGAQGFVNMLEGVMRLIAQGELDWEFTESSEEQTDVNVADLRANEQYRFCTECLIQGEQLDLGSIRAAMSPLGDSLIVAGGADLVRVHIHTDRPQDVFAHAEGYGEIQQTKAEDMLSQYESRFRKPTPKMALITDSSCDVPTDFLIRHQIHVVPVRVAFGPREYLDRVTITAQQMYRLMVESPFHPKTSQPAPADFVRAYRIAAEHHSEALALMISSQLSGTFQAGVAASRMVDNLSVEVFDTKSAAGGHGLLLMMAAELIDAGCDRDEVMRRLQFAQQHVVVFAALDTIKFAVLGGRVGRVQGWLAAFLGLVPILRVNSEGKIEKASVSRPGASQTARLKRLVGRWSAGREAFRAIVCHANAEQRADEVASFIGSSLAVEVPVLSVSPTLGAHVGPGTVAVCMLGLPVGSQPWN